MILAVCMVFTMSSPITVAEASYKDRGESVGISGFVELPKNIRRQSVPLGTSLDAVNLPDTLEATVYTVSEDTQPPTEPEEQKGSGEATPPASDGGADDATQPDEPASKSEIIPESNVPLAASPSDANDATIPDAGEEKTSSSAASLGKVIRSMMGTLPVPITSQPFFQAATRWRMALPCPKSP